MSRTSIKPRRTPKTAPRSRPVQAGSRTTGVGRIGKLGLEYIRQGDRTVFGRTSCQTPWHLLPPIYLDDTGSAYTLLVNPSGGLVAGDQLSVDLSVGPKAHVLISTPSANRVYRSLSKPSVQDIRISVGPNGILEWVPEHTIPFAGSRFRQTIDVTLESGATLLLWDAMASGRIASGERWAFTTFENLIQVRTVSKSMVKEHFTLEPADQLGGVGLVEGWDYVASLFIIGDAVATSRWLELETMLAGILDQHHGHILGGVSPPAAPGLVVKFVAKTAPDMTDVLQALWTGVRKTLWSLPPAVLRKY